jgi:hypothetical protein
MDATYANLKPASSQTNEIPSHPVGTHGLMRPFWEAELPPVASARRPYLCPGKRKEIGLCLFPQKSLNDNVSLSE